MLSQILNTLQSVLIPVIVALLVVGAGLVWWVGRPRKGDRPGLDRSRAEPVRAPAAPRVPSVPSVQPVPPAASAPPPAPQPPTAAPAAPAAAPLAPLAADLLLVDDSAVVRAKLRRLFEPAGYRVALARDGQEALQLLAQGRYALMVTDLEMPNLDGVGLINAVQGQPALAQMPIMAITGHDDLQARLDECREICGIYRKPWIDDDLLGHVQMLVGSRSAHTAQAQDH